MRFFNQFNHILRLTWKTLIIEKRLPWKLQRALSLFRINGLRSIMTTIQFLIKKPKYRIVVSSIYFGGIGGTEKDLMALVESMEDCLFYIHANNINHQGFIPSTNNYYLNLGIPKHQKIDLYYYYAGGGYARYLGNDYDFKCKVINTNANDIRPLESSFDHVLIQSENYADFFDQHEKRLMAFPEVERTFPKKEKIIDIPKNYFITVFNPFSSYQKGYNLFLKAADHAQHPILWCYNNKTKVKHDNLPDHPNIIKLVNLDQEELFYVYRHAKALISFSNYESFGWALAEAFFCNIPIISRKTGFLDYVHQQKGINIYENEEQLFSILKSPIKTSEYNNEILIRNSYKQIIASLIPERTCQ